MQTTSPQNLRLPPVDIRRRCLEMVIEAARQWQVAPGLVVAHCSCHATYEARRQVMLGMLDLGLKRYEVAFAFGRDLRRVRASVLGR